MDTLKGTQLDVDEAAWRYALRKDTQSIQRLKSKFNCSLYFTTCDNDDKKLVVVSNTADTSQEIKLAEELKKIYKNYIGNVTELSIDVTNRANVEKVLKFSNQKIIHLVMKVSGSKTDIDNLKTLCQTANASAIKRLMTLKSGLKIFISKESIIKVKTEAIVNSANPELDHDGGAAGAISRAAGPNLDKECKDYIKKYGELKESQAWHSTSGNLAPVIKYVIHTVGPRNTITERDLKKSDRDDLLKRLTETFYNCMKYANDKLKVKSVAFPFIGSGLFSIPLSIVAKSIFDSLDRFSKDFSGLRVFNMSLKEVHFVNIDDIIIDVICDEFDKHYSSEEVEYVNGARESVPQEEVEDPIIAGFHNSFEIYENIDGEIATEENTYENIS